MLTEEQLRVHVRQIKQDGYTILERVIEPELIDALVADLYRLEREHNIKPAKNLFEGTKTVRIYNLLAHGALYECIPVHENVLPLVERVLDTGCLVSSLSSVAICPGERAQPVHADDQLIPIPRPHLPVVCNTMWALTDFTGENGATRLVPGSHRFDSHPVIGEQYDMIAAEMPKGSVLVWHGSLWHGGGANRSCERRIGIAMNYCAGFIRQQENQQLGIPRETACRFSRRLRELVGYSVYNGLIGHIEKRCPMFLLDEEPSSGRLVWDTH